MTKPNLILIIITLAAVLMAVIVMNNSCNNTSVNTRYQDSITVLKRLNSTLAEDYGKQRQSDSEQIAIATHEAEAYRALYDASRQEVNTKGKQLLATNERLKQALVAHDTPTVYIRCDSVSRELDSVAALVWAAERRVDSLLFVNDDLKAAQVAALNNCHVAIEKQRQVTSALVKQYEAQLRQDEAIISKQKRGRWLDRIIGVGIGGVVSGFVGIFKH